MVPALRTGFSIRPRRGGGGGVKQSPLSLISEHDAVMIAYCLTFGWLVPVSGEKSLEYIEL